MSVESVAVVHQQPEEAALSAFPLVEEIRDIAGIENVVCGVVAGWFIQMGLRRAGIRGIAALTIGGVLWYHAANLSNDAAARRERSREQGRGESAGGTKDGSKTPKRGERLRK